MSSPEIGVTPAAGAALIEGRFDRIAGLIEVLRSLDDYVVLSAVPALVSSLQRARTVCVGADYTDPAQLRDCVDAAMMVLQAGALCTVTGRDDDAVETIRRLRTSLDFLIPSIAAWLVGNRTFAANLQDGELAAIDPTTIILIVQLVVKILAWWQQQPNR